MFLLERAILKRKIEKGTLKFFEFRDLCDAYTACEKGAEELLVKLFKSGFIIAGMMDYMKNSASAAVKELYTKCTGKKI